MIRETSVEAYQSVVDNGSVGKKQKEVYQCLYEYGPMSGGELYRKIQEITKQYDHNNSNVLTRLSELREMGTVKEIGKKVCSFSGKRVINWDVTENSPVKIVPKKYKLSPDEKRETYVYGCLKLQKLYESLDSISREKASHTLKAIKYAMKSLSEMR